MMVVAPAERAAADGAVVADVVAAIDHEVDRVLVSHAFEPPVADAKRGRRVRAGDDDELARVVRRIERGEIADVAGNFPGEKRRGAAGSGTDLERRAIRERGGGEAFRLAEVETALVEINERDFFDGRGGGAVGGTGRRQRRERAHAGGPDDDFRDAGVAIGRGGNPQPEAIRAHRDGVVEGERERGGLVVDDRGGRDVDPLAGALKLDGEAAHGSSGVEAGVHMHAEERGGFGEFHLEPPRAGGSAAARPARRIAADAINGLRGGELAVGGAGEGGAEDDRPGHRFGGEEPGADKRRHEGKAERVHGSGERSECSASNQRAAILAAPEALGWTRSEMVSVRQSKPVA